MPKIFSSDEKYPNRGKPKPPDFISYKLSDLMNLLGELILEFDRKKTTVDNNSVFIIQPNKHHLDHLSEDQCKIFIRIFNICLWLIELGFYNFWLSTTKELEIDPEFEELIKSLENAREQFKHRNIAK